MTCKRPVYYEDNQFLVIYDIKNLNIHVEDSHRTHSKKEVEALLKEITSEDCQGWKYMVDNGYTRTLASMRDEWCAHNVLYNWGVARARTGSVDMDQGEPPIRKLIYSLLATLYR